ncbi:helix-turn-helix transcriptional regulator [Ruegeria pomeroyi]|nr:helix-turn-helix transcriptional regulator [Ruegeria pomeroyi]
MYHQFSLELRTARRKAGLTQADCGYLLGGSASIVKQLEDGRRAPSLEEICTLSLIFGRSFEAFFGEVLPQLREELSDRLGNLPHPKAEHASTYNRQRTLEGLAERLADEIAIDRGP